MFIIPQNRFGESEAGQLKTFCGFGNVLDFFSKILMEKHITIGITTTSTETHFYSDTNFQPPISVEILHPVCDRSIILRAFTNWL